MPLRKLLIIVVGLLIATAGPAVAEDEFGLVAKSHLVIVKPEKFMEFEAAYRQHLEWHSKNNDPWPWHTWQIVNGENLGQYIIRTHGHQWKDFDAAPELRRSDADDFKTKVAPYVHRRSSVLLEFDPKISNWPSDAARPALVEISEYELSYQGYDDFRHAVKKIRDALLKTRPDIHYAWSTVVNGSNGPTMILAVPRASWADFEAEEVSFWAHVEEVLGAHETGALRDSIGSSIRSERSYVVKLREDLSYEPK
jgi:hypothetical protein